MITLACVDLAGTTVTDDGVVEAAFGDALPGASSEDLAHVRATMGTAKIEVFRHLLGGDEKAAHGANERFERAYAGRLDGVRPIDGAVQAIASLRDHGVRVCLTTGFSATTRDALLDRLGWQTIADLSLTPQEAHGRGRGRPFPDLVLTAALHFAVDDVRDVAVAGDTSNDLIAGWRAGASIVAGVLTGAHDRSVLEAAPHTHVLDSIADLPPVVQAGSGAAPS